MTLEDEAVFALRVLVEAKTEKELLGKTERYEKLRNRGWNLAKQALALADQIEAKKLEGPNMPEGKPILCLDFDGVIHSYSSPWAGADVIPDPPVPGALGFIIEAQERFQVHIHSSRSHQPGGVRSMRQWLSDHFLAMGLGETVVASLMLNIEFPKEKPPALVTIDDRAIQFNGVFPLLDEIANFKPWNRRDQGPINVHRLGEILHDWYERTEYDEEKVRLGHVAIEALRRRVIDLERTLRDKHAAS